MNNYDRYSGYSGFGSLGDWLGASYPNKPSSPEPSAKVPTKKQEYILSQPVKVSSGDPSAPMVFNEFMTLFVETVNADVLYEEAINNPGVESVIKHEYASNSMSRYYIIVNPLYDGIEVYQNLKYNFDKLSKAFDTLLTADAIIAAAKTTGASTTKKD